MRRLLVVIPLLLGCASAETINRTTVGNMADAMYPRLSAGKKLSIAIIGFVPMGGAREGADAFSTYLVEELTLKLVSDGRVAVAERAQLEKVLQELKLQSSGMVSDSTAKQLGELLGVDGILVGTYMDQGKEVKVNQRVIAAENGQILAASSVMFPKNKIIKKLLPRSVRPPR